MKRIRFFNIIHNFPYVRQLPTHFEERHDCRFYFGAGSETCDYLVCYDELMAGLATSVPRERRLLIIGEPPCITRYPAEYLNQFGVVICPYELPRFKGNHIKTSPALWWFYGINPKDYAGSPVLTWDELEAMDVPKKTGDIATVCSNKMFCRRHENRRTFAGRLQRHFGNRLTIFGPGYLPLPDKKDAIDPFRYQIVIENNDERKFWTEKLADAFLGYALPLYVGGPEVEQDFPEGSLVRLDIRDVEHSVAVIEKVLAAGLWEERLPLIRQAREKVLNEYNTFSRVAAVVESMPDVRTLPPLNVPERMCSFVEARAPYHFKEHINHMAIKHLPLTGPLFKI